MNCALCDREQRKMRSGVVGEYSARTAPLYRSAQRPATSCRLSHSSQLWPAARAACLILCSGRAIARAGMTSATDTLRPPGATAVQSRVSRVPAISRKLIVCIGNMRWYLHDPDSLALADKRLQSRAFSVEGLVDFGFGRELLPLECIGRTPCHRLGLMSFALLLGREELQHPLASQAQLTVERRKGSAHVRDAVLAIFRKELLVTEKIRQRYREERPPLAEELHADSGT